MEAMLELKPCSAIQTALDNVKKVKTLNSPIYNAFPCKETHYPYKLMFLYRESKIKFYVQTLQKHPRIIKQQIQYIINPMSM